MYIEHLKVDNLKILERLEIDFMRGGEPRPWTVLLGENGLCKTTILQAIAMAANGYVRANQLADVPSLPDRRNIQAAAQIEARFSFSERYHSDRVYPGLDPRPAQPPRLRSWLQVPAGHSTAKGGSEYLAGTAMPGVTDPVDEARARGLPHWFVAGYGTSRLLPRPMESEKSADLILGRLLPLFDRGRLVGTGFADLLEDPNEYARLLREALVSSGLLPYARSVELRGRGGIKSAADLVQGHRFGIDMGGGPVKIPATWLSQGYQSTVAWIADLIGQVILEAGAAVPLAEMEGLVLIDEIDLHLHPRWQVSLVPTLKRIFPRLQFVATTHSPMMLPGLDPDELVVLALDGRGNVVVAERSESPALMTGSQLYRTFFGIDQLYPNDLGEALHRYGFLAANPVRSDAEDAEMNRLIQELRGAGVDPGWEPVAREMLDGEGKA